MPSSSDMEDKLRELNLTKEENDKFAKAFKDPKFIELFSEYAKEVSDPKVKEETDLYLRQLEAEGRGEEVYGKDVTLIVPEAGFVVKTVEPSSGKRAYINLCTSSKVDPLRLTPVTQPDGRRGQQVEIPLSLGPQKEGQDKEGKPCLVFDFVVAPATLDAAHANPMMMQTLVETAMENIDRGYGIKLGPKFKQLKLKYKATPDVPTPHVLSVRGKKGEGKPLGMAPSSASAAAHPRLPGQEVQQQQQQQQHASGGRSSFSFTPKQQKPQETDPAKAGYKHPGGEVTPTWSLTHRGEVDLAQCWGDASRNLAMAPASYPRALVVRLQLPGVNSAAGVELDVGAHSLCVVVPGKYKLDAPLPYPVKEEEGKAKFDKAKSSLEVVLPTQPPALPPPAAAIASDIETDEQPNGEEEGTTDEAPMDSATRAHASPSSQGQAKPQQPAPSDRMNAGDGSQASDAEVEGYIMVSSPNGACNSTSDGNPNSSSCAALQGNADSTSRSHNARDADSTSSSHDDRDASIHEPRKQEPGHAAPSNEAGRDVPALTENQKKWLELHHSQQQAAQTAQHGSCPELRQQMPTSSECGSATSSSSHFEAASSFQGPRQGYVFRQGNQGLGYYADVQQEQQPQPPQQQQQQEGNGRASGGAAAQKALAALQQAGVTGPMGIGTAGASSKLESSNDGQQVPSVPSLKPRLTSSLAHELD